MTVSESNPTMGKAAAEQPGKALVIIAGNVNYFYNLTGHRIAEALRNIGVDADVATIGSQPKKGYDWCFLVGLAEIVAGYGDDKSAIARIEEIQSCCNRTAVWNLESMTTRWFTATRNSLQKITFDLLMDTNIHAQEHLVPAELRSSYRYVFYGLTQSELASVQTRVDWITERPIPWVTVGHATPERVTLAERLVKELDPCGIVYLPRLSPVTETGPHLNAEQLKQVLLRCRYQVWTSHHKAFYMEGERFRVSLLYGVVPIKVESRLSWPLVDLPFPYLISNMKDVASEIRALDFEQTRNRFAAEYCSRPTLEAELSRVLAADGAGQVRTTDAEPGFLAAGLDLAGPRRLSAA